MAIWSLDTQISLSVVWLGKLWLDWGMAGNTTSYGKDYGQGRPVMEKQQAKHGSPLRNQIVDYSAFLDYPYYFNWLNC